MQIEMAPDIEAKIRKALRSAGRCEIGGMLFAEQLALSHFRVIDFSLDIASGSHTTFRRDPHVHENSLYAFFDRTGKEFSKFNYLGEWHSHPAFSVNPSIEDIFTMTELVSTDEGNIFFAVLLIVRLGFLGFDYSWTIFSRDNPPRSLRKPIRWI